MHELLPQFSQITVVAHLFYFCFTFSSWHLWFFPRPSKTKNERYKICECSSHAMLNFPVSQHKVSSGEEGKD